MEVLQQKLQVLGVEGVNCIGVVRKDATRPQMVARLWNERDMIPSGFFFGEGKCVEEDSVEEIETVDDILPEAVHDIHRYRLRLSPCSGLRQNGGMGLDDRISRAAELHDVTG